LVLVKTKKIVNSIVIAISILEPMFSYLQIKINANNIVNSKSKN